MDSPTFAHRPWQPPFCPNPNCNYHQGFHTSWPYKRHGFFSRHCRPHRIQRFQCRSCHRTFSAQTFTTTYWLKRPDILPQLFMKTIGGMANRQIARDLAVAPATVDHQLSRLGRHCLLFHWQHFQQTTLEGPLVIDGFESFELSQYFPFHHNLAVEAKTSFFAYFTDSPLRRKGRMRPDQRRRRQALENALGRPDPRAVEQGVWELLTVTLKDREAVELRRDDHRAYPRAMRGLPVRITDRVTPSHRRRDADNPLFEVNLLDLLIRHSSANHRRETIAWSKRRQRSAERLAVLLVWRNYVKRRREKGPWETPAMLKGLCRWPLTVAQVLARRRFRGRVTLPPSWSAYYAGQVQTPALGVNREHRLRYAW